MINSPSGRLPAEVPRWDLEETETCGGEKRVLAGSLLVSRFLRIYGVGIRASGATRWGTPPGRARRGWRGLEGVAPPGAPLRWVLAPVFFINSTKNPPNVS